MSGAKSDAWEHGMLLLLFTNTSMAGVGDAGGLQGSALPGDLYVSLHTGDPGEAGDQTTNEIAYTGYARTPMIRSAAGWAVTGSTVNPATPITFPPGTGGSGTATHFGIGTDPSGAGTLLYFGPINPNIVCGDGVTPQLGTGSTITED